MRRHGFWEESTALGEVWGWAQENLAAGRLFTAAHPNYPLAWRSKLGAAAPPAVYTSGPVPALVYAGAIVGSRHPTSHGLSAVRRAAGVLAGQGRPLVSGGAQGVDTCAAAAFAGSAGLVEILPHGLPSQELRAGSVRWAVAAPGEGFSSGAAMERNLLIYALAEHALVVEPRFRRGGSWHGAAEALRRRVCRVGVVAGPEAQGAGALAALGAFAVGSACSSAEFWRLPPVEPAQPGLFGSAVREATAGYAA